MAGKVMQKTDLSNLISNLRGELGAIIESWTLMREFCVLTNELEGGNFFENNISPEFNKRIILKKKLKDDIISRLSELAQTSYGKINFFFAANKIGRLNTEFEEFRNFIVENNFKARRDEFISHKRLPPQWKDHKRAHPIYYLTVVKAIAKAIILMKKIDDIYLGENSNINWRKLREIRYDYQIPARARFMQMYHTQN